MTANINIDDDEFFVTVHIPNVYTMRVCKNDNCIGQTIMQGEMWEMELSKYLLKYIKPDTTFIDIGANIGTHAVYCAKNAKCHIEAFEPYELHMNLLKKNIQLNNIENVKVHDVGLTSEEKKKEIFYEHRDLSDVSIKRNFGGYGLVNNSSDGSKITKMATLDDYNFENVSVIKCDVEGHEICVLEGAVNTIKRNKPVLIIEIWDDCYQRFTGTKIFAELLAIGYTHTKISSMDYLFIAN